MAERRTGAAERARGRGGRGGHGPGRPAQLAGGSWWVAIKRDRRGVPGRQPERLGGGAHYYSVLWIFPALLVLVDLAGQGTIQTLVDNLGQVASGSVNQLLEAAINNLGQPRGSAGVLALVSLATALWLASRYVAAFMRASNAIYDVPQGRPIWKTCPSASGSPWSSWSCWRYRRSRSWPSAAWPSGLADCWGSARPRSGSGTSSTQCA